LLFNHACKTPWLPSPSHSTSISLAGTSTSGATVSTIVKVAVVLTVLPHASVATNVTVALPVAPHSSLKPVKSLLQVTAAPLHKSLAIAPPLLSNQPIKSSILPLPSHSTVTSLAGSSKSGAVVSTMVKLACVLTLLPHSSVAIKLIVVTPVMPH